jgi:hypothetical protein
MKVNISNAIKIFYPSSKFVFVYFEAIANSIDANATEIKIFNRLKSLHSSTSIEIEIQDNGNGFTDCNFAKFSKLLDFDSDDHKGIGRLVFLNYFNKVNIESMFEDTKRKFVFDNNFTGKCDKRNNEQGMCCTSLKFFGFNNERLKSYEDIYASSLKESIIRHFFPLLYDKKLKNEPLTIKIFLEVEEENTALDDSHTYAEINANSLDDLESVDLSPTELGLDLFSNLKILYSINKTNGPTSIITAVCSDGRTIPLNLLSKSQIPQGYEIIFIVFSDFFAGKSDSTRQSLSLTETETNRLKSVLSEQLSEILTSKVPEIYSHNIKVTEEFTKTYPHLNGYFNIKTLGLIDKSRAIENAQSKFFAAQREILESKTLNDEQYEKSIEVSSRVLLEYILYRTLIIKKLKMMNSSNSELDIHKIIIPTKKKFTNQDLSNQYFFNNAWILDDKYMNFSSILSDLEMSKLAEELKINGEIEESEKRPDIAIVFSEDIKTHSKVDVVIVELKKLKLPLARREEVVSQLRQRARLLLNYYPDKIQRIWFYGIVDIDLEFETSLLEDEFVTLYSNGKLFYREYPIIPNPNDKDTKIPVGIFILDYTSIINDAEVRNNTFLNLLKSRFNQDS